MMLLPEVMDCQIKNPVPNVGYLSLSLVRNVPETSKTMKEIAISPCYSAELDFKILLWKTPHTL